MNIHEYQSKDLFAQYQIPIIEGFVCNTVNEVVEAFKKTPLPVVIKAQVLAGGRGKAGGIKLVNTEEEARNAASNIIGMKIKGLIVEKVLVLHAVEIVKEVYVGFINDRNTKSVLLMASAEGGVEIEETAKKTPEKILKLSVNIGLGVLHFQAFKIASQLFTEPVHAQKAASIIQKLYMLFIDKDCSLAEINPLVITSKNEVIALDAKLNFDDNALFRHPDIEALADFSEDEIKENEAKAKAKGLSYIRLDGNIGCMVNGAGLAMATMDMIKLYGGSPANFLDIGGSSNPQKVVEAMKILLSDVNVKAVMINIFGGITRCDDVAKGLTEAMNKMNVEVPVIVRLSGTNSKEGLEILKNSNLLTAESMSEAAKMAISFIK